MPLEQWPDDPFTWLREVYPEAFGEEPGDFHEDLWRWVWSIRAGVRPRPYIATWSRGLGKSTTAEVATVAVGARGVATYGWYISATEALAADHLATIETKLGSPALARWNPGLGRRRVGTYGGSKGWRRTRLSTEAGLTVDAVGLLEAKRGAKNDDDRPDWIVFDDVDQAGDSPEVTAKKLLRLSRDLLGAKARGAAILGVQNLIHETSIFSILTGRTSPAAIGLDPKNGDFLLDRIAPAPVPAVYAAEYEQRFVPEVGRTLWFLCGGTSSWPARSLASWNEELHDFGLSGFKTECQHDLEPPKGGVFGHIDWEDVRRPVASFAQILFRAVAVDPAVSNNDGSDSYAIAAGGYGADGRVYKTYGWESTPGTPLPEEGQDVDLGTGQAERPTTSEAVLARAILKAVEIGAGELIIETDQGGETWASVYARAVTFLRASGQLHPAAPIPRLVPVKAAATQKSKYERWQTMAVAYDQDRIRHGPNLSATEAALQRAGARKPFDLADADWWLWDHLTRTGAALPPMTSSSAG